MATSTSPQHVQAGAILVLVHPGSACGSADFNLGKADARACRDALAYELASCNAGLIVIDGELSCELSCYPVFQAAIDSALARAKAAGHVADRIMGNDPHQVLLPRQLQQIRDLLQHAGGALQEHSFTVSGAWYHPEDGSGCVGAVIKKLRQLGCRAEVSEAAVPMPYALDTEPCTSNQLHARPGRPA